MTDPRIEKVARALCWSKYMDPDAMVTAEVLYQVDDIKVMPTLPPFPAWQRYVQDAKAVIAALDKA